MSPNSKNSPRRAVLYWSLAVTVVFEAVTVLARIVFDQSAAEFNATNPPLLMQIHHMFWSVPLLIVAACLWRRKLVRSRLLGAALGLILSDLIHHFIVLPLWAGNTGWHWP